MKFISLKLFLVVTVSSILSTFPVDGGQSPNAIEIISIKNSMFNLNLPELESILGSDEIKDRHVVVVSIVGPYRTGKSFLLNFFLKYLYAQYKTHDVSKWLSGGLSGFKFRYGRTPETTGIWMWGEVFTHDFDEDNKVAIILMDTQGIFDSRTTPKESTTIFALTMMMSSVQCFNIMHNIQEDNLQHLELFAQYGRLALGSTVEKPFQKLLFIVRDWNFGAETGYGWAGNKEIDSTLAETDHQNKQMHQLRRDIKSSFQEINAFLLPSPGDPVKDGRVTVGSTDLNAIAPNFIENVNVLVTNIFEPRNLKVKTVNGLKLRAGDLIGFLKKYIELFNGDTLPEPTGMAQLMSEVYYNTLTNKYVEMYVNTMNDHLKNASYKEYVFLGLHQKAINEINRLSLTEPKFSDKGHSEYQKTLTQQIDSRFKSFAEKNAEKQKAYELEMKERFSQLVKDCFDFYGSKMVEHSGGTIRKAAEFSDFHRSAKDESIAKFVAESDFGGEEEQRTKYKFDLIDQIDKEYTSLADRNTALLRTHELEINGRFSELVKISFNHYISAMDEHTESGPCKEDELVGFHQQAKSESLDQFAQGSNFGEKEQSSQFELKLVNDIDREYRTRAQKNSAEFRVHVLEIENRFMQLVREGLESYVNEMTQHVQDKKEEFAKQHDTKKAESISVFTTASNFGSAEQSSKYQLILENEIAKQFILLSKRNVEALAAKEIDIRNRLSRLVRDSVNRYSSAMMENDGAKPLNQQKFQKQHESVKLGCVQQFDAVSQFSTAEQKRPFTVELESEIERTYNILKGKNAVQRKIFEQSAPNGDFWIKFVRVQATILDDESRCDPASMCDPFIILKLDGNTVHETDYKQGEERAEFNIDYNFDNMKKNTRITIEMWDYDSSSGHDLIMSKDTSVEWLLNNNMLYSKDYKNYIQTEAKWTPRIED